MKKILIVEDEDTLLRVLKDRFKKEDWDVTTAVNGEEAVEKIREKKFNLILLDLIMPKKTGFEVLEEVKNDPDINSSPIIVLSNLGADEEIKEALSLGADDYYVKSQHPLSEIVEKANSFQKKITKIKRRDDKSH